MRADDWLSVVLEFTRTKAPDDPFGFQFAAQTYTLRTPGGGAESVEVPWSQALLADLEAVRQPGRDPAVVKRVGESLRTYLKRADWKGISQRILAALAGGRRVALTIRSNAAELYVLPWELLTLGASGRYLGALPGVLIRYEWPETVTTPHTVAPPPEGGRILYAWAGNVPDSEHNQAIVEACKFGYLDFDPTRDVLAHASVTAIAGALKRGEDEGKRYAALHLLCHGAAIGSTFGLALHAGDGTEIAVDADALARLLCPHAGSLRLVVLSSCDSGNVGGPANHLGSIAQALHRGGISAVVASRFPLSVPGSNRLARILYEQLLGPPGSLEQALLAVKEDLLHDVGSLDWASLQLYARVADGQNTRPICFRPYTGLLALSAEHQRFFFGREAEVAETLGDLQALVDGGQPRFLVVAGASGTGKSSVVMAGVIPFFEGAKVGDSQHVPAPMLTQAWEIQLLRPGNHPSETLERVLQERHDPNKPLLLVIDQFEELFTHTDVAFVRQAFAQKLWALAKEPTGVHILITIRVDFLGRCGELVLDEKTGIRLDRVAYQEEHRIFVAQMSPEQMRLVIEGPTSCVGLSLQEGLTNRMLSEVGDEPGGLPLLAYVLDQLWARREGAVLSAVAFEELGGVIGSLEKHANRIIDSFNEQEQEQARRLLTRLVNIDAGQHTRRRVAVAKLVPGAAEADAFGRVVSVLVDSRLIVRDEDGGGQTLEIGHEALIRKWQRLGTWIEDDRRMLAELSTIEAWVQQYSTHKTLLVGAQLEYARSFVERYPMEADVAATELIRQSTERIERKKRIQTRIFRATIGAAIAFAFVGAVSIIFYYDAVEHELQAQKKEFEAVRNAVVAEQSRQVAEDLLAVSESNRIAGLVKGVAPERIVLELLLAVEAANKTRRREVEQLTLGADRSLRLALSNASENVPLSAHDDEISFVNFDRHSARLLTTAGDTIRIWFEIHQPEPLVLKADEGGVIHHAEFDPGVTRVVTGHADNVARIWRVYPTQPSQASTLSRATRAPFNGRNLVQTANSS